MQFRDAPRHSGFLAASLALALCVTSTAEAQKTAPPPTAAAPSSTVELAFWNSIQASSDPADFRDYLSRFPEGIFAGLAQRRLSALETPPAPEKPAQSEAVTIELAFWQSIANSTNAEDFRSYLARYPAGSFAPLATNRIAALQKAEGGAKPGVGEKTADQLDTAFHCPAPGTTVVRSDGKTLKFLGTEAPQGALRCTYLDEENNPVTFIANMVAREAQPTDEKYAGLWPLREGVSVKYHYKEPIISGAFTAYPTDVLVVKGTETVKVEAGEFPALLIEVRRSVPYSNGQTSYSLSETLSRYWYSTALNLTLKHDYRIISGIYGIEGDDQTPWEAVSITPGPRS